jgi:hypothetical protein
MDAEEFARKIIEIIDGMGDNDLETISVIEKYCQKLILEKVNTGMFKAGAAWKEEKMKKEAIDATIHPYDREIWLESSADLVEYNEDEQIKVVILKK